MPILVEWKSIYVTEDCIFFPLLYHVYISRDQTQLTEPGRFNTWIFHLCRIVKVCRVVNILKFSIKKEYVKKICLVILFSKALFKIKDNSINTLHFIKDEKIFFQKENNHAFPSNRTGRWKMQTMWHFSSFNVLWHLPHLSL